MASRSNASTTTPDDTPVAESGGPGVVTETRLDDHVDKPSTNAPGDAPHDTTDPTERATSVIPSGPLSEESLRAGTVNAVQKLPEPVRLEGDKPEHRVEEYDALRPDGTKVRVSHNIDTGRTNVIAS